jgi:hypothetical protein
MPSEYRLNEIRMMMMIQNYKNSGDLFEALKMTYEGAMAAAVRIADINTPVITNG